MTRKQRIGNRSSGLNVVALAVAINEARDILNDGQYAHLVDVVKRLVDFGDPHATADLRIEQIGRFWELKEKGGLLGSKNIRVYFAHVKQRGEIVLLSTYKKDEEGKAPRHIMIRLENRLKQYLQGQCRIGASIHHAKDERRG